LLLVLLPQTQAQAPLLPRVLVVDDDRDGADMQCLLLSRLGHDCRVAYDAHAAIEEAASFRPQAVLLDLGMPGLNGYEAARRLRQLLGSSVLLVALTGYSDEAHRLCAAQAGFDHYLVKPADPREVIALLRRLPPPPPPRESASTATGAAAPAPQG